MMILTSPLFASQSLWNSSDFNEKVKFIDYKFFEDNKKSIEEDLKIFQSIHANVLDYFYKNFNRTIPDIDFSLIDEDLLSKSTNFPIDFKTTLLYLKILDKNKKKDIFSKEQKNLFFKIVFEDFLSKNSIKKEELFNFKKNLEKIECEESNIEEFDRIYNTKIQKEENKNEIEIEHQIDKILKINNPHSNDIISFLKKIDKIKLRSDSAISLYNFVCYKITDQQKKYEIFKLIFNCVDDIKKIHFIFEDIAEEINQETFPFVKNFLKYLDSNVLLKVLNKASSMGNYEIVHDILQNNKLQYDQKAFGNIIKTCFQTYQFSEYEKVLKEIFLFMKERKVSFDFLKLESINLLTLKPFLPFLSEDLLIKIIVNACSSEFYDIFYACLEDIVLDSITIENIIIQLEGRYKIEKDKNIKLNLKTNIELLSIYIKGKNISLSEKAQQIFLSLEGVFEKDFRNKKSGRLRKPEWAKFSAETSNELEKELENVVLLGEKEIVKCAHSLLENFLQENSYLLSVLKGYAETSLVFDDLRLKMMSYLSCTYLNSEKEKQKRIEERLFKYLFENWVANGVFDWNLEEQEALEFIFKNMPDRYLKTNINPFSGKGSCIAGQRIRAADLIKGLKNDALYDSITPNYSMRVYQTYSSVLKKIFDPEYFLYANEHIKNKAELEDKVNEYIESILPEEFKQFISEKIFRLPVLSSDISQDNDIYKPEIELLKRIEDTLQERI